MRNDLRVLIVAAVAFLLPLGCSDSITCPEIDPPFEQLSDEAKLVALCLSGELRAPCALTRHVESDLATIRTAYQEQHQIVKEIQFRPPWVHSCLMITFDYENWALVRGGEYNAWDDLNEKYGVTRIDIKLLSGFVLLYFEGIMHPRRLREAYRELPGIRSITLDRYAEGGQKVCPRSVDGNITYLFQAGGDFAQRPVEYFYFILDGGSPTLVGSWEYVPGEDPPGWWEEARQNINLYRQF